VHTGTRWYLLAWDLGHRNWRTLRMDRLHPQIPTGPTFAERVLPKPDAVSYVLGSIAISPYRYRCRVTVDAPAHEITEKIGVHAAEVTPLNDR
jgi:hypothetical protein